LRPFASPKVATCSRFKIRQAKKWGLFDKVNGTDATRRDMERGRGVAQIVNAWQQGVDRFRKERTRYLIY
jgi:uncharacterized protein YbbC (DUF1343 family)